MRSLRSLKVIKGSLKVIHQVILKSHVSGLAKESMEQFQIANYGIGGQYNPHYDYFIDEENMKNNRIATWLGYISEVQGGGGTAFPLLSLIVSFFLLKII